MSNEPISKLYQVNEVVVAMGQTQLQGDVIPHEWYSKITHENGKPDPVAVALLAHIVYWYRPVELLEHARPVWYKKFAADFLQKSYDDLQKHFGFTRKQLLLAFRTLERLKLAQRILRTIYHGTMKVSNVLFIEIFPKAIADISQPTHELKKKVPSCPEKNKGGLLPLKAIGGDVEGKTNTETTTETTKSLVSDIPPTPFRNSKLSVQGKRRSQKSLGSKKEPISLNDPISKLQIRFHLSGEQADVLMWLKRVREDLRWDGFDEDGNYIMDDGFMVHLAKEYPKDALVRAIGVVADNKPKKPGAYLRRVLKGEKEAVEDMRSVNFNTLKAFKEEKGWDALELGNKSAWYIENGVKEKVNLEVDPHHFEGLLKMKFSQYKRHQPK